MSRFHLCRFSKSGGPEYRHLFPPLAQTSLPACQDRHLQGHPARFGNTSPTTTTTETPITNGMRHQGRLHGAPEVVRIHSTPREYLHYTEAPPGQSHPCTTADIDFGHLNAIDRHWEGPLTSLSVQEMVAVSLEQASSFIKEARELVATGSRSQTAIRHDITGSQKESQTPIHKRPHSLQPLAPHSDHRRE